MKFGYLDIKQHNDTTNHPKFSNDCDLEPI